MVQGKLIILSLKMNLIGLLTNHVFSSLKTVESTSPPIIKKFAYLFD